MLNFAQLSRFALFGGFLIMKKYEALELEVVVVTDDILTASVVAESPIINYFSGLWDEQA